MTSNHKNHKNAKNDKHKASVKDWHSPIEETIAEPSLTETETSVAPQTDKGDLVAEPGEPVELSTNAPLGAVDASSMGSGQIPFGFGQAPNAATSARRNP